MILDDIVASKKRELPQAKAQTPLRELEVRVSQRDTPLDFGGALCGNGVSIIAEVKKASPSRGLLCPDFDPLRLAMAYAKGGAAAISVLTESITSREALITWRPFGRQAGWRICPC